MTDIVARERLQIGRNGSRAISRFTLDALTEGVLVRIARSTPSNSVIFSPASRLQVNMHFRAGTDDFVQGGFIRGGDETRRGPARTRVDATEARIWRGITKGYFGGDTLRRLGEYKNGLDVVVELLLDGDPIDTFWQIETFASQLSGRLAHRSAAYDTSNTAFDSGTYDGVVTVGLTTTGSNLRGCAAGWNIVDGTPQTTSSMTWDAVGMTQIADLREDIVRGAGYYYNGVNAGSESIVHTLTAATGVEDHGVVAVSVEDADDVDESTSAQWNSAGSWSGTIATPDSDGLIIDMIGHCHTTPGFTFGANQTEIEDDHDGAILNFGASYQSGADGGAMTEGTNPEFGGGVGFAVHFQAAAAGSTDNLLADDLEAASEVSSPAVGQVHALTADDLESASELTKPAVGQIHGLAADDIESISEVSSPAIGIIHPLTADDLESVSELTKPVVGQIHVLVVSSVESQSELSSPILLTGDILEADDLEAASEVSSPSLGQIHALTNTSVESASQLSTPTLGQLGNWDLTRVDVGWFDIIDVATFSDPEFLDIAKLAASAVESWIDWIYGVGVSLDALGKLPRGSANMTLNLSLIIQEADGSAAWARWEPGSPRHPGNLQLNLREALTANFTLT